MVIPAVKKINYLSGYTIVPKNAKVVSKNLLTPLVNSGIGELRLMTSLNPKIFVSRAVREEGVDIIIESAAKPGDFKFSFPRGALSQEAYQLSINDKITIKAMNEKGAFYGLLALGQLIRQFGLRIPRLNIYDWPDLEWRGISYDLARLLYVRIDYLRELIRRLAWLRMNKLFLYLETSFKFKRAPEVGAINSITPEEIKELQNFAALYNVELVPMFNFFGHTEHVLNLEKYWEIGECPEEKSIKGSPSPIFDDYYQICPTNPKAWLFVKGLLEEVCSVFSSNIIHAGGDEAVHLGACPRCKRMVKRYGRHGKGKLYVNFYKKIHRVLSERGKGMALWGDMIIQHPVIADKLSRDIIIFDWHYGGPSPVTLAGFKNKGYKVIGTGGLCDFTYNLVPLKQAKTIARFYKDVHKLKLLGGCVTSWETINGQFFENQWHFVAWAAEVLWNRRPSSWEKFSQAYEGIWIGKTGSGLFRYLDSLSRDGAPLIKNNSRNLRQNLYHHDNPTAFWENYYRDLADKKIRRDLNRRLRQARQLWKNLVKGGGDAWIKLEFLELPLLTLEHLLKRFECVEEARIFYHRAAVGRTENHEIFIAAIHSAVKILKQHSNDFSAIEGLLKKAHEELGTGMAAMARLEGTRNNIKQWCSYLKEFARANRALPSFILLNRMFFEKYYTPYWVPREEEWLLHSKKFKRYSLVSNIPKCP